VRRAGDEPAAADGAQFARATRTNVQVGLDGGPLYVQAADLGPHDRARGTPPVALPAQGIAAGGDQPASARGRDAEGLRDRRVVVAAELAQGQSGALGGRERREVGDRLSQVLPLRRDHVGTRRDGRIRGLAGRCAGRAAAQHVDGAAVRDGGDPGREALDVGTAGQGQVRAQPGLLGGVGGVLAVTQHA
jgi:hypothetical protein